jgi:pyruvate kinase
MKLTEVAPSVPLHDFKRTKIIATLGPASDEYEKIVAIIKAGANVLRLNFSHGTHEEHAQRIKLVRKASQELGKPVAILQDLQGPKIRLGDFDGIINVQTGQSLSFEYQPDKTKPVSIRHIPVQYDIATKIQRGERLYLYDGKVRTTVSSVKDGIVYARAENDGILIKRKGMNLPDTDFGGDIITRKDREDMAFGSTQDIDYVAMSFVQGADDIHSIRKILKNLGGVDKVIAKIETNAAVDNIEEIVETSDAIMIARGDLAVEAPAESVPIVQRKIIGLGLRYSKPTIVATQMLLSMTDMPEPTRAEVSDVATAVLLGADCVMLSEESAAGKYPVEAVQTMKRIIRYTESHASQQALLSEKPDDHSMQCAISRGLISLAESIEAKAIVAETKSGATALQISSRRPEIPLIAVTSDMRTVQQLALVYGVKSYLRPADKQAAQKLTDWLRDSKVLNAGDVVVTASGRAPGVVGTTDTIKVRILE